MIRQESSWHLHTSLEARENRWNILRAMAVADFHYQLVKLKGLEETVKDLTDHSLALKSLETV